MMYNSVAKIVFCTFTLFLLLFSYVTSDSDDNYNERRDLKYSIYTVNESSAIQMDSMIFRTAYKYLCYFDKIRNPEMLVYGIKSWTFPRQNINLTLSYPTKTMTLDMVNDFSYIITGFSVILFTDTRDTRGYINSGGIMKDSISLSFEFSEVTSIRYQFWVYGVPGDAPRLLEHTATGVPLIDHQYMC